MYELITLVPSSLFFNKNIWGLLTFLSYFDWYSKLHPEEIKNRKQELKQRQRQSKSSHTAWRKQFTAKQMVVKNKPFFSSLADVICTNSLLESNYQTHQHNKSICKTLHLFFFQPPLSEALLHFSSRHLFQQSPSCYLGGWSWGFQKKEGFWWYMKREAALVRLQWKHSKTICEVHCV